MKFILGLVLVFGLFVQNVFAVEVKSEILKDGIVANGDASEGHSEPCRT